jgi:hypothetical protein
MLVIQERFRLIEEFDADRKAVSALRCHDIESFSDCTAFVTYWSDQSNWRASVELLRRSQQTIVVDAGWDPNAHAADERILYWAVTRLTSWPTLASSLPIEGWAELVIAAAGQSDET